MKTAILLAVMLLASTIAARAQMEKSSKPAPEVDGNGNTKLMLAAQDCSIKLVTVALASKPAPDTNARNNYGDTALLLCAAGCQKPYQAADGLVVTKMLLDHGANVNLANRLNMTALYFAALHGNIGLVQALLEAGADPLVKTKQGKTALDMATAKGFKDCAALLQVAEDAARAKAQQASK